MNNSQIAHAWVHNTDPEASRSGSNFFYEGLTLYSYGHHFPVARTIERKGKTAVLFTTKEYSNTTSRHKSLARKAIPHDTIFHVENVADEPKADTYRKEYQTRLNAAVSNAIHARGNKPFHIESAQRIITEANQCAQFFGWKWKLKADLAKLQAEAKAALEKQRERDAIQRDLWLELKPYVLAHWRKHEPLPDALNARWRKLSKHVPQREAWLRLSLDKKTVETSLGAKVPASDAPEAWRVIQYVKRSAHPWNNEAHAKLAVGGFKIDRIDESGNVKAGCHVIPYEECEYIAKELAL